MTFPSTTPVRVAVLGAGLMGSGIAKVMASAGHAVQLFDERAETAEAVAGAWSDGAGGRITAAKDLAGAIADADLILEAVFEDLAVKHDLYRRIDQLNPDAIIASNTSTFLPSELARALSRPQRLLVAHFFNPPAVVPLVEVVPHEGTDESAVAMLVAVLENAGKRPVVLERESPGFVANRLQAAILREALHLQREGIATMRQIDEVVTAGLGSRWAAAGPFRIADLGGLDVWGAVAEQLFPHLAVDTGVPPELAESVARGDLGVKSGGGLVSADSEPASETRLRMERHFAVERGGT